MNNWQNRFPALIILVCAVALLVYTIVRAALLEITTDEAFSFLNYVRNGILFPTEFNFMSANHHLLNTLGMWFFNGVFGGSEFALRIPNLIGHGFYLFFTARFVLRLKSPLVQVVGFVILNAHPYLLDFFSLARGYGLSWGMLSASLYHVFCLFNINERIRYHVIWFTVFGALAIFASFVLLYVYIAALLFVGLYILLQKISLREKAKNVLLMFVISTLSGFIVMPLLSGLKEAQAMHWGSFSFSDMLYSLARGLWYDKDITSNNLFENFIFSKILFWGVCLFAVVVLVDMIRTRCRGRIMLVFVSFLMVFVCVMSVIQHTYFEMLYPAQRTAFYLVVLFLFLIVLQLDLITGRFTLRRITALFLVSPVLFSCVTRMNFSYSLDWAYCEGIEESVEWIRDCHVPVSADYPVLTLSVNNEILMCTIYYRDRYNMNWLSVQQRPGSKSYPRSDYYITDTVHKTLCPLGMKNEFCTEFNHIMVVSDPLLRLNSITLTDTTLYAGDRFPLSKTMYCTPQVPFIVPEFATDSIAARLYIESEVEFSDPNQNIYINVCLRRRAGKIVSEDIFAIRTSKNNKQVFDFSYIFPYKIVSGDTILMNTMLLNGNDAHSNFGPQRCDFLGYRK